MRLQTRMYFFVAYNLLDIQKGIQAGHASDQYSRKYANTKLWRNYVKYDKTWIILNGGTTRDSDVANRYNMDLGSLNEIALSLDDNKIQHATFREPDLNMALTAVCFIADERVWDKEMYPDFEIWAELPEPVNYTGALSAIWHEWKDFVGGEKNVFLRELLRDKRLA